MPPPAQSFQHRAEMQRLRAAVEGGGTAVLCQVLTGMGGVGKTQLAADYAHTAWETGELDVLVWITASTRTAIVTAYAQAGVELCQADPADPEQAAKSFLAWLTPKARAQTCRWLIVLDDVADPADLHLLWPPAGPHGRTLATTRRRDAALTGEDRRRMDVGLFTEAEAAAYLTACLAAHGRQEPDDQLTALASDLGHLPLALSQAAAYIVDTGLACAAYRARLADRTRQLSDLLPERGTLPDDQPAPVDAAWSLSVDRANQFRPAGLARPMLHLTAMLDPNGIPDTVLTSEPALAHLTAHRDSPVQNPATVTAEDAADALRALHRLSLITHTPGIPHHAVRVHELIQRAMRDQLTPDRFDRLAYTAADAVFASWPATDRNAGLAQALRANTTALTTRAGGALYRPNAHVVLFRTGRSLGEAGQVAAAIEHFCYLTDTATRHLGLDSPYALAARYNLAHWRREAGDPVRAARDLAVLAADQVRVLGPDHPDILNTRGAFAHCLGMAGDVVRAEQETRILLAERIVVLGPDDPSILSTLRDLVHWQAMAGNTAKAAKTTAIVLNQQVQVLGLDHPDTLITRGTIAHWRGVAGDAAGAADELGAVLEDFLRVLGPDHPHTLVTLSNLAHWRGVAGDAAGAADELGAVLGDSLRVLGPDHPQTLAIRSNIAHWQGEAGDAAGAAQALAVLLEDLLRVLGPDHPHTRATQRNIPGWMKIAAASAGER
ncbi:FxSxx-COOH system tetratricopeptide repeat protein [Streptomyces sp. NPDC054956]